MKLNYDTEIPSYKSCRVSGWVSVVKEFIESNRDVALVEEHGAKTVPSAAACLKRTLNAKGISNVGVMQRGENLFLYKKEVR